MTVGNDRERMQLEIERLNGELHQAHLDEQAREEKRKQELDTLRGNVSKREEKLDKLIKKQREKTTIIDEDERRLDKTKV